MDMIDATVLTQFKDVGATQALVRAVVGHASDTTSNRPIEDFFGSVTPDDHAADAKGILLALADGLSGGAGRAAAESLVYSVLTDFYSTAPGASPAAALSSIITATNRWLFAQNGQAGEGGGMLSTLSVLLLCGRRYHLAHVGDTRVYLLRDRKLTKLTTDHVWRGKAGHHLLRRAVGLDAQVLVDFNDDELATGDLFLMLTDGVWEAISETEMIACLTAESDPQRAAEALVEQATLRSGHMEPNDATAVVIRIDAAPR
jgi:serine/threonine protein phosphatase PrpC